MPKDNNQQPIAPTTNSGDDQFPVFVEETLPPMPQGAPTTPNVPPAPEKKDLTPTETPITTSGSAAPQDDEIMPPTVTKNKKKFAGGKVIATILGLFLLVGGVGAGVLLVNQNQNISEKAYGDCPGTQWYCGGCVSACIEESLLPNGCAGYINEICGSNIIDPTPGGNIVDFCNSSGCTGKSDGNCFVMSYHCNSASGAGCQETITGGPTFGTLNFLGSEIGNCGTEQIDVHCDNNTYDYVSKKYDTSCSPVTVEPPVDTITASCSNIKVYTESWSLIEEANLSSLSVGDNIKFCVNGVSSSGSFDMARITANGTSLGETQEKRPETNDFCSSYTIPAGTTTFNITSQIHHISEGWK